MFARHMAWHTGATHRDLERGRVPDERILIGPDEPLLMPRANLISIKKNNGRPAGDGAN